MTQHMCLVPEEGGVPLTGVVEVKADAEDEEQSQSVGFSGAPARDVGNIEVFNGINTKQGGEE